MKTRNILLAFIISLSAFACNKTEEEYIPNGDCLTILLDRTDEFQAPKTIKLKDFLPLLKVTSSDPTASANVRLAPITNIRFEKTYFVGIPQTDEYSMNELERKILIDTMKEQVQAYLNVIKNTPVGMDRSSIFEQIALELNSLATCYAGNRKRMVILSDLHENTNWFNTYRPNQLDIFIGNQKCFNEKMDSNCPIRYSIKGIVINLVHQPQSVLEDDRFYKISELLKTYYENKGAIVHVASTLNK
jgi:hypothetical protein